MSPAPDDLLYHYTTLEALISILESSSLWASDLESMNDPAELVHTRELGEHLCLGQTMSQFSLGEEILQMLDLPLQVLPVPSENIPSWVHQHFVSSLLDRFQKQGDRAWKSAVGRVFGVSFCKKGDLLSQWRAYGLTGSGVSIGFDKRLLQEFDPLCKLAQVEYGRDVQMIRIQSFMKHALDEYADVMKDAPIEFSIRGNGPDDIAIDTAFTSLVTQMAEIAHTFKRPGFSEEEEFRLIKTFPLESERLNEVKLRVKDKLLLPYVVLNSTAATLPIREIVQGPAYQSHNADYALIGRLKQKGYPDVRISRSKFSLR